MIELIKEIVDEIKKAEAQAVDMVSTARERGNEVLRKAAKQADHIKGSIHRERKQTIHAKMEESIKNARRKEKSILKEAEEEAARTEREARKFLDDAVNLAFERVTNYGD